MKTVTKISPRYEETDKMGVIHHSVYPVWYEVGRVDFCREMGMPFDRIEATGLYLAVIELTSKYIRSARFGEDLQLITYIKSFSRVKLEFGYELYDANGVLINTGSSMHAWLDLNYRPVNLAKVNEALYHLIETNAQTKN